MNGHLTVTEAAEFVHMSRSSIYAYIKSGDLATKKTPGGHHRIARADAEALLTNPPQQESVVDRIRKEYGF